MHSFLYHAIFAVSPTDAQRAAASRYFTDHVAEAYDFPKHTRPVPPTWAEERSTLPHDEVVREWHRRTGARDRLLWRLCQQLTATPDAARELWAHIPLWGKDTPPVALALLTSKACGVGICGWDISPVEALARLHVVRELLRAGIGGELGLTAAGSYDPTSCTGESIPAIDTPCSEWRTLCGGAVVLGDIGGAEVRVDSTLRPWVANTLRLAYIRSEVGSAERATLADILDNPEVVLGGVWDTNAAAACVRHYCTPQPSAPTEEDDGLDG